MKLHLGTTSTTKLDYKEKKQGIQLKVIIHKAI